MFPSRASSCKRSISAGGGRLDREIEAEGAAHTDTARHFDVASHQLHVAAADRQAESGSTAPLTLGNLLEWLEDRLELTGRNTDAGIVDLESQPKLWGGQAGKLENAVRRRRLAGGFIGYVLWRVRAHMRRVLEAWRMP